MAGYVTPGLERWRHYTDVPLFMIAIGSLTLLFLELERQQMTHGDRIFLDIVNLVVLVAFAIDYGAELLLARPRRAFVRGEWTSLLIVIAQVLALLPGLAGIGALRALRAGRVWRLVAVVARVAALRGAVAAESHPTKVFGLCGGGSPPMSGTRLQSHW